MCMLLQLSCYCSIRTRLECNKSDRQLLTHKINQDSLFSDFITNQWIELSMVNFSKKENRNAEKWAMQPPLQLRHCCRNL
jgi:hypothetical protein